MPRLLPLAPLAVLALAACGGGGGSGDASKLPSSAGAPGAQLVVDNGCLGCHRLGTQGSGGPGPELTAIGAELSAAEISRVLVDPPGGMPSFESVPPKDRDAIAAYLSRLR